MKLYCGTSGFSYKQWCGPFYPDALPAADMLTFYATRLPSVEINNTFYRMPKKGVLAGWQAQVPEHFRFVIKAPRRISHSKRLVDCAEEMGFLVASLDTLGSQLGALLVQLPPYCRADVDVLRQFLAWVPERIPAAFEFRHDSWQDDAVRAVLREHNAALVHADKAGTAIAAPAKTANWTYLRLRAPQYTPAKLRGWHKQCQAFEQAFVFFKHEDAGIGPALAQRMMALQEAS
jgi:uncharacterized protein YecE (DUF72 family)